MKHHPYILLFTFLSACASAPSDNSTTSVVNPEGDTTTAKELLTDDYDEVDTTNYDYATYFVVVADTSKDYFVLQKEMYRLNQLLDIPMDTMGRYFNKSKNLIALPDDDEDEIYAGDYFPRRFPSENMSLEYLHFYKNESGENTIALVTGIYENESSADSAVSLIGEVAKKTFKIEAYIYVGCMH